MICTTLLVQDPAGIRQIDLAIPVDATVDDVCAALGLASGPVLLDGRTLTPGQRCGDVAWPRGALLTTTRDAHVTIPFSPIEPGRLEWLTGPDLGRPAPPDAGHARPFVRIGAHWAIRRGRTPTFVAGVVPPGAVSGPVHRGLRGAPPRPTPPLDLPATRPLPPAPPRPGWATLLLPVVVGLALAVLVAPMLALFALLAPVTALASWIDDRWRRRRDLQRSARDAANNRQRFLAELAAARQRALERAWAVTAVPGDLLRALVDGTGRLWHAALPVEVMVGAGPGELDIPVRPDATASADADAARHLDRARTAVLPHCVSIAPGRVIGIAGPARQECAQAIVLQAAALAGPADLGIATPWSWSRWLPHAVMGAPATLTVVDAPHVPPDEHGCVLVLAADLSSLPPEVQTVVVARPDGMTITVDGDTRSGSPVLLDGARAEAIARAAARWDDPRAPAATPVGLLDAALPAAPGTAGVPALLGHGADGPVQVDLVRHGPHALIAGTTGSGKSELLRTLVATAAAVVPPERLALLFLDFKGGATFDPVASLPHVVGLVTDLDGSQAARTLRILRAEIERRERLLRDHGASDVADAPPGVVPRLVVVVDEAAALVTGLPDALGILTDVAQRGRSLGVHLVLATQRPQGVIGDALRANLALRVCLRTERPEDAIDVAGTPVPAAFAKDRPGCALVTGSLRAMVQVPDGGVRRGDRVVVLAVDGRPRPPVEGDATDLERVVGAGCRRWGDQRPSMSMPDPLPDVLDLDALTAAPDGVTIGLIDRPDDLRVDPLVWDGRGHLLVHGRDTAATAASLEAVVLQATTRSPAEVHVYGIGTGGRELDVVATLPHTAVVVDVHDRPGLQRLLARLEDTSAVRDGDAPATVLVVPRWDLLERALDDGRGFALRERLHAVLDRGRSRGLVLIASTTRPATVPAALLAGTTLRIVCTLGDPTDHAVLGRRAPVADIRGRGYLADGGEDVHLAMPRTPGDVAAHRRRAWADHPARPEPLPPIPRPWGPDDLPAAGHDGHRLVVPVGRSIMDGRAVGMPLLGGEHVLIAGPRGSGRTSLLRAVARRLGGVTDVAIVTDVPGTWNRPTVAPSDLPDCSPAPVVLVDDADRIGAGTPLDSWVEDRGTTLVVAATASRLRATVPLWLATVKAGRTGLLLGPSPERDTMLLDVVGAATPPVDPGLALAVVDGRVDTIAVPSIDAPPAWDQTMAADDTVGFARTKSTIRCT